MDTTASPSEKPQVKFSLSFTPEVDVYIAKCQQQNISPSIKGFAEHIGTDENSIWAWATKHTKDENGKPTDQLARPSFFQAIQKLKKFEDEKKREEHRDTLNQKQEKFCQLYASEVEFFGNGTQSYIEAYGIDTSKPGAYNGARASASELLTKPNILKRIDELLEVDGLNDQAVDKELAFVILQKADLGSKVAAIREYNKLKTRVITKLDHTTNGKELPTPIYGGRAAE
jgi:hypothetical protein